MNIDMIKNMGINGGHILGDLPSAMIATEDIAEVAAHHLLERSFSGKTTMVSLTIFIHGKFPLYARFRAVLPIWSSSFY
ncbi:MAG: hypothetical protein PVJ84_10230 [Desulfobacteraceae bacterium]|jgi:hypothetical protein